MPIGLDTCYASLFSVSVLDRNLVRSTESYIRSMFRVSGFMRGSRRPSSVHARRKPPPALVDGVDIEIDIWFLSTSRLNSHELLDAD